MAGASSAFRTIIALRSRALVEPSLLTESAAHALGRDDQDSADLSRAGARCVSTVLDDQSGHCRAEAHLGAGLASLFRQQPQQGWLVHCRNGKVGAGNRMDIS